MLNEKKEDSIYLFKPSESELTNKSIKEDYDEKGECDDSELIMIKKSKIFKEQKIQPLEYDDNDDNDNDSNKHNENYSLTKTITLSEGEDNFDDKCSDDILPSEIAPPQTKKLPLSQLALKASCNIHNDCNEFISPSLSSKPDINPNDIQQLKYEYQKELCRISIRKEKSFIVRMLFDLFKRQTLTEKIEQLVEFNKKRIKEEKRIRGFNRLIEDANRRLEIKDSLEFKKMKLMEQQCFKPTKKTYKNNEWVKIYHNRFMQKDKERNEKLKEKIHAKKEMEIKKENDMIEESKVAKLPLKIIKSNTERMYDEARKRRERMNDKINKLKTQQNDFRLILTNIFDCGNRLSFQTQRDRLTVRNKSNYKMMECKSQRNFGLKLR